MADPLAVRERGWLMTGRASASVPRVRNRRGDGQRLRAEIVAAATEIIEETGDAQRLSLREVARRIGVSAPSIYQHFPDIDHLRVAVAENCFAVFAVARRAATPARADPVIALLARCRAYSQFAMDHPGPYRFMFSQDVPRPEGPTLPAGMAALRALAASIRECQHSGAISRDDEPEQLAVLVWAALHGLVLLRMNLPRFPWPAPLPEMVDQTVTRLITPTGPDRIPPPTPSGADHDHHPRG